MADTASHKLPWFLGVLFCINGFTLGIETLPLMFVLNTKVEVPLKLLPVYGTIAFMPYSLKPFYAYIGKFFRRDLLLAALLVVNSLTVAATAAVPKGAIELCLLLAFLRGLSDSWAELNLGFTLLDTAHEKEQLHYASCVSRFQSHAASWRNLGSFLSGMASFTVLFYRRFVFPEEEQLSNEVVGFMFFIPTVLNLVGATIVVATRQHFVPSTTMNQSITYTSIAREEEDDYLDGRQTTECTQDDSSSCQSYNSLPSVESVCASPDAVESISSPKVVEGAYGNVFIVVLLQLAVIAFGFKSLIVAYLPAAVWRILFLVLLFALACSIVAEVIKCHWSPRTHGTGLFLVIRHAIPSSSMLLSSYFYYLFTDSPLQLQFMSVLRLGIVCFSSWSFGFYFSEWSEGVAFQRLVTMTTILEALASLLNIFLYRSDSSGHKEAFYVMAMITNLATGFFEEWNFLPDIVLASRMAGSRVVMGSDIESADVVPASDSEHIPKSSSVTMEYASLVSCIDFGDQLGSLLAGPLVVAFGLSREDSWEHFDSFLAATSLLSLIPLVFIEVLKVT